MEGEVLVVADEEGEVAEAGEGDISLISDKWVPAGSHNQHTVVSQIALCYHCRDIMLIEQMKGKQSKKSNERHFIGSQAESFRWSLFK